mgnify:CR=1 FL=1
MLARFAMNPKMLASIGKFLKPGFADAAGEVHKLGLNLGGMQEFVGGIGGDMVGMAASDAVTRGKDLAMGGRGETGWERMSSQQQEQMRQEMEQSILAQYGMVPGGRYDDYLRDLGMV